MAGLEYMTALANSRDPADRIRLLEAILTLSEENDDAGRALPPVVREMMDSLFLGLVGDAERDLRQRLSDRLAEADWAPKAMLQALAVDEIEIAAPIIAASPLLQDQDLIDILIKATVEHQIAVARRPGLGAPVVEAIVDQGDPAVMTALAGNDTAQIEHDAMLRLVDAAEEVAALRSPLARHPRLTSEVAERLYAWVGESLRAALVARFRIDGAALDAAIRTATEEASRDGATHWTLHARRARQSVTEAERALIHKLHEAEQLRPSYLLRALREGRLNMFVEALAVLGDFESTEVRQAIDSDKPELMALALVAVGVDRSAFRTMLSLVRQLNADRPGGGDDGERRAIGVFGPFTDDLAGMAFKQAVALTG